MTLWVISLDENRITGVDIKRKLTALIKDNFKITPMWDEMKEGYKKPSFFVYFLNLQRVPTSKDSVMYVYPVEVQYQGSTNLDALKVAERFDQLIGNSLEVEGKHLQVRDFSVSIESKNAWIDFEIEVVNTKPRSEATDNKMRTLHMRYEASGDYDKED